MKKETTKVALADKMELYRFKMLEKARATSASQKESIRKLDETLVKWKTMVQSSAMEAMSKLLTEQETDALHDVRGVMYNSNDMDVRLKGITNILWSKVLQDVLAEKTSLEEAHEHCIAVFSFMAQFVQAASH